MNEYDLLLIPLVFFIVVSVVFVAYPATLTVISGDVVIAGTVEKAEYIGGGFGNPSKTILTLSNNDITESIIICGINYAFINNTYVELHLKEDKSMGSNCYFFISCEVIRNESIEI